MPSRGARSPSRARAYVANEALAMRAKRASLWGAAPCAERAPVCGAMPRGRCHEAVIDHRFQSPTSRTHENFCRARGEWHEHDSARMMAAKGSIQNNIGWWVGGARGVFVLRKEGWFFDNHYYRSR